jgi:hypothetical protein
MTEFKLDFSDLSEHNKAVKQLKDALSKSAKQGIPFVTTSKATRKDGATIKPLDFGFENGQKVSFLVRQDGDIYRVLLNDKPLPLKSDYTMLKEMTVEIGKVVIDSQKSFSARMAKAIVKIPKIANKVLTTKQRVAQLEQQEATIDASLAEAVTHRDELKAKLEQAYSLVA